MVGRLGLEAWGGLLIGVLGCPSCSSLHGRDFKSALLEAAINPKRHRCCLNWATNHLPACFSFSFPNRQAGPSRMSAARPSLGEDGMC